MCDDSVNAAAEHARWIAAADKRKRHAEAAQRSRQRQREGIPMRRRRTAAELADLAAKPPDMRTPQENKALHSHEKEMRRTHATQNSTTHRDASPVPLAAAAGDPAPAAAAAAVILAMPNDAISRATAPATPSMVSIAPIASHASSAASAHPVSASARPPCDETPPPVRRFSMEQCKWVRRVRQRAMKWLATGHDQAPPPVAAALVAEDAPPPQFFPSPPSSLPSVADAVREALAVLQPLLPLGDLLTLHGMGQGRRAPTRAASVPDAAYEEREQLRRLKETHDALLKQASKPRPQGTQACAAAATAAPIGAAGSASSECSDSAAAAAAASALLAVATNTSHKNAQGSFTDPSYPIIDVVSARLQAQQKQLDKFAAFHGVTHTQDSPELLARATAELALELRPNRHGGVLGVFATRDLDAATFRCPYPGWIMSHALHAELQARFHIPTAIKLRKQQRTLVGDPGALGCIIKQAATPVNMTFAWEEMPRQGLSLCLRPTCNIAAGEELVLLQHGDGDGTLEHHCQVCFARECSAFNEMFLCEGTSCSVGQHEHCFPNATAIPKRSSRSHWFCEAHAHKQRRR